MELETAKAINEVSKKVNRIEAIINKYFMEKHQENADAISVSEEAIADLADIIGGESDG